MQHNQQHNKHQFRFSVGRGSLCFLLLLLFVATPGCGGGGSQPKDLYTRVERVSYTGSFLSRSIALDADRNIYAFTGTSVSGSPDARIIRFVKQSSGQYTASRVADGEFPLAVSPVSGRIFVNGDRQIKVYDNAGQLLTARPLDFLDITINRRGEVFTLGGGIARLDEDGNELGRFPLAQNYLYAQISTDADGNVAVLGAENVPGVSDPPLILRVYAPQGTLLRETTLDKRGFPSGYGFVNMTVGREGKLYITLGSGSFTSSLNVFDYQTGTWLGTQAPIEDGTGDIAVDADGNLYVMGARQISIYKPNR
jgi:outer membrane protein assembly factor BamB